MLTLGVRAKTLNLFAISILATYLINFLKLKECWSKNQNYYALDPVGLRFLGWPLISNLVLNLAYPPFIPANLMLTTGVGLPDSVPYYLPVG